MKRNPVAFGEFLTCFSRILDFMTFQRPYIHDIGKVWRPIRPSMLKGLTVPRKTLNLVPIHDTSKQSSMPLVERVSLCLKILIHSLPTFW